MAHQNQQGTFQGVKEFKLYYQSWYPASAKAVLILVHGHGGHSSIFSKMVDCLLDSNYAVYGFDLRGNGRSQGQRGYINNWAEFRQDLKAFTDLVKTENPHLPLFLLGQSLGGAIVLDYTLREPDDIKGLILMSPALGLGISRWLIILSKLFSAILPHFTLDTGIDLSACSRDPQAITVAGEDSLRHSKGTTRLATELLKTIEWIEAHATELQTPILILHGGADRVTLPENSRAFFNCLTLADKEMREYPDSYHELHQDFNSREVFADILNWLDRHLSAEKKN